MSNKLCWPVTVEGREYLVRCETHKTVFDVYVDDELVLHMGKNTDGLDTERDIRVGGKVCQFVVYGGEPDLAVDGILQGVEASQHRAQRQGRWLKLFGGIAVLVVSTFAAFLWYAFEVSGQGIFGGWAALLMIIGFAVLGLWMMVSALKSKGNSE